jgi:hypothetical protein
LAVDQAMVICDEQKHTIIEDIVLDDDDPARLWITCNG